MQGHSRSQKMSSGLLTYHHILPRQKVLVFLPQFLWYSSKLLTTGSSKMSWMTELVTSMQWVSDPAPCTCLTNSYPVDLRDILLDKWVAKMLRKQWNARQRPETASTSYLSHLWKGLCHLEIQLITQAQANQLLPRRFVALGETTAFWPERKFRHFLLTLIVTFVRCVLGI